MFGSKSVELLDIGNVVTVKGVKVKPNHPFTRFFPKKSNHEKRERIPIPHVPHVG
jgi:hypothetical protein